MELQNFKTSKPKLPQLESLEELFQQLEFLNFRVFLWNWRCLIYLTLLIFLNTITINETF